MGRAFSNGTEWEMWAANWCYAPCQRDVLFQRDISKTGCEILFRAMFGDEVPPEWVRQPDESHDRYHCIEFRPPGWRKPEPQPQPPPQPGPGLFPKPEQGVQILIQPQLAREMADA